MPVNQSQYDLIIHTLRNKATLVAVSKTKPVEDILALYQLGQRDFGENYVQELLAKQPQLPADIRWHFIGHLQTNKAKQVVPLAYLIHGIDSGRLLQEINKQAQKINKTANVLLQVHIAKEESKFGFDAAELDTLLQDHAALSALTHVRICGLMGMSSLTTDETQIGNEFAGLKELFDKYAGLRADNIHFQYLSMGMSGDYPLALAHGSNMVRIGSLLFGKRE